ncbi:hypothetical protein, partial [Blautia obeum]|uniref:hypothetical protein n=1 Tax=Blautia obeum TaxID=40520 RepID=UPI0022E88D9F
IVYMQQPEISIHPLIGRLHSKYIQSPEAAGSICMVTPFISIVPLPFLKGSVKYYLFLFQNPIKTLIFREIYQFIK